MFDPSFEKLYCGLGVDRVIGHPSLPLAMNLTKTMLIDAREHLFGSIQISTKKAITVHKYLNKYKDTLDGILVWIALLKEKDNGGNTDVRIQNLFAKTQKPFTTQYPGGLLSFVHDLESAYAELDILGMCVAEPLRKMNLLGHLDRVDSTVTDFLSQQCRDKYDSFEECIAYLKDYATRKESVAMENSQRMETIVSGEQPNLPEYSYEGMQDNVDPLSAILQEVNEDISTDHLCSTNLIKGSWKQDESLCIPKDAWKLLLQVYGKEIKKFTDARKLLEAQLNAAQPPSPEPIQTLSDQAETKVDLLSQEPQDTPVPDSLAPTRRACSLRVKNLSDEHFRHVNMAQSSCLQHVSYLNPAVSLIPLDNGGDKNTKDGENFFSSPSATLVSFPDILPADTSMESSHNSSTTTAVSQSVELVPSPDLVKSVKSQELPLDLHSSTAQNSSKEQLLRESDLKTYSQMQGSGDVYATKQVTLSDQQIPVDKSLSHQNSTACRLMHDKVHKTGFQRIPWNWRQNIVQMVSFEWVELLVFFLTFGSLMFCSSPIFTDCFSNFSKIVNEGMKYQEPFPNANKFLTPSDYVNLENEGETSILGLLQELKHMADAVQFPATRDFQHGLGSELVTKLPMYLILAAYRTLCEWSTAPILWQWDGAKTFCHVRWKPCLPIWIFRGG